MQKDFHHAVTYTIARLAGLPHYDANIIGSSAQYVDDAVGEGVLDFTNGTQYRYIASAHKDLDRRNFREQENRKIWIPFHFVPGNDGKKAKKKITDTKEYEKRLICRKNSYVAQDMVAEAIKAKNEPWSLHLFGITMHVYADTWAHQDFIGKVHKYNNIRIVDKTKRVDKGFLRKLKTYFRDNFDDALGRFVRGVLPLGHGAALANPDLPFLKWAYLRKNEYIERDNAEEYTKAVKFLYRALVRFRLGDPNAEVDDLPKASLRKFQYYFRKIDDPSPEVRHMKWVEMLKAGEFGFKIESLPYQEHGTDSWVYKATGIKSEDRLGEEPIALTKYFVESDWKLFHDALLVHRFNMINRILPAYGIVEPYA